MVQATIVEKYEKATERVETSTRIIGRKIMEKNETKGIRSIENTFLDKAKNANSNSNIMIVHINFRVFQWQEVLHRFDLTLFPLTSCSIKFRGPNLLGLILPLVIHLALSYFGDITQS
jgi:hypothetical protein